MSTQSSHWPERRLRGFDYADPNHAYFVTTRAQQGTAPFTDERLLRLVIDSLNWLRDNRGIKIYAYTLMPDHLHLLLQLGQTGTSLPDTIAALKRYTTRQSWQLGYSGSIWQRSYHDRIVRRSEDGKEIARYILYNPVRKGLVALPDEYPYSGTPDPL